jgi:hypothetical protein
MDSGQGTSDVNNILYDLKTQLCVEMGFSRHQIPFTKATRENFSKAVYETFAVNLQKCLIMSSHSGVQPSGKDNARTVFVHSHKCHGSQTWSRWPRFSVSLVVYLREQVNGHDLSIRNLGYTFGYF